MAEGMYVFAEVGVKGSPTQSVYELRIKTGIVKCSFLNSLGAGFWGASTQGQCTDGVLGGKARVDSHVGGTALELTMCT